MVANFSGSVVACPREKCHDVIRDPDRNIPRGFYTEAKPGDPVYLCITQNPAQPSEPAGYYTGGTNEEKAARHISYVIDRIKNPQGIPRNKFVRRVLPLLSKLIDFPEEEVLKKVVITTLAKCTTPNNKRPSRKTMKCCYETHLIREMAFWRPQAIVAMGGAASGALGRLDIDHVRIPHPTHRRGDAWEAEALAKARAILGL